MNSFYYEGSFKTMLQLNHLLPQDQWEPYWTLSSKEHPGLPENINYMIFEFYCTNNACDCQSLVAEIMALDEENGIIMKPLAQVRYDWSSEETRCYPSFAKGSPETPLAICLLDAYKNLIHNDEYQKRIEDQYTRVKKLALDQGLKVTQHEKSLPAKTIGRNDPCPCGSNKKYKKCCLNNKIVSS